MMQKKQIHLASLGAGFLMLGLPSVGVAQTTQLTQNVTTAANPQVVERRWQAHTDKATYEHLMVACQSREFQLSRLNQLQDVANNLVEFDRIEVVDINEVLKGENAYAFQQLHASHTKAEHLMLEEALNNTGIIVPNTNKMMKLKQALLNLTVKPESITGVRVPDITYGKLFVFYDSK